MNAPVDLTNLRDMTDGDAEMEKALFDEFICSFETGMEALKANMADSDSEAWRKQAHGLKGIALNLGAGALGELCKDAQDNPHATATNKTMLLDRLRTEHSKVKQFLMETIAHGSV